MEEARFDTTINEERGSVLNMHHIKTVRLVVMTIIHIAEKDVGSFDTV